MDAMALELQMFVNCYTGFWESNPGIIEEEQVLKRFVEVHHFSVFFHCGAEFQHKPQRGQIV